MLDERRGRLANGASSAARDDRTFARALHDVCASLARQIVEDGEGKTVLIEVRVSGAPTMPRRPRSRVGRHRRS